MRPKITILTDPVPSGRYLFIEPAKSLARKVRRCFNPLPAYTRSKYRGHFAVTRSLVEGLQKIGVNASYNPPSLDQVADAVVVLSGLGALRQAIEWKRAGRIKRLLAGPNLVAFPSDARDLLAVPEVNLYLTPCEWTDKIYLQDCPELKGRSAIWPAGVDVNYWRPAHELRDPTSVLIFEKQNPGIASSIADYVSILERRKYRVNRMVNGCYTLDEYFQLLQHSCLMVGFTASESQGIAWAEAWSADVPTLLWFQDHNTYKGRTFASSTAPYLSVKTGLFFSSLAEFESVLIQWEARRQEFQPRKWVLENMSDEVCARKLCVLAGVIG